MENSESYFDGGLLGLVGTMILSFIITALTFGIGLPWAICLMQKWFCEHTVIDGRRLRFDGTGTGMIGTWIKIILLTIVTLGIYSFWAQLTIKKWVVSNTHFE